MPATKTKPAGARKVVKMKASRRFVYNEDGVRKRRHLPKGEIVEMPRGIADAFIHDGIAVEMPGEAPTVNSEPVPVTPNTPKD